MVQAVIVDGSRRIHAVVCGSELLWDIFSSEKGAGATNSGPHQIPTEELPGR